jgi:hypothetical protein
MLKEAKSLLRASEYFSSSSFVSSFDTDCFNSILQQWHEPSTTFLPAAVLLL